MSTEAHVPVIADEFRADNAHLRESIKALIGLNDSGSLTPHGIGGHARSLLAACYHRLPAHDLVLLYSTTMGEHPVDIKSIGYADAPTLAALAWSRLRSYLVSDEAEDLDEEQRAFTSRLLEGKPFAEGSIYAEIVKVSVPSQSIPTPSNS